MKIFVAQMEVVPAAPQKNFVRMIELYQQASQEGAHLVVYPELCLSGYLLGDMWEELDFIKECVYFGIQFATQTQQIPAIFGNVALQEGLLGEDGRPRKMNASFVAQNGKFLQFPTLACGFLPKILHPNYREFDDERHFFSLRKWAAESGIPLADLIEPLELDLPELGLKRVGIQLCEDGWDLDYSFSPTAILASKKCDLICNLSASPFTKSKELKRERVFKNHAKWHQTPVVYVNQVGVQNNGKTFFVFDGNSAGYSANGQIWHHPQRFVGSGALWDTDLSLNTELTQDVMADIYLVLSTVIRDYIAKAGIKKVVIGASGGIDSAVAAALYVSVLGDDGVVLVNMPSKYNSSTTISAAEELAKNLNCGYLSIPIEDSVALTVAQVQGQILLNKPSQSLHLSDFALENIQARDRSSRILAAVSAAVGGVFTCNANKTEMTVGYSTLYGDHGGFLAVLGDLWKHEVYALGTYMDQNIFKKQVIPQIIYDIIPSAELSSKQDVNQGLGDPMIYWYHDRLFRSWVENWNRATPVQLLKSWINNEIDQFLDLPQSAKVLFKNDEEFVLDLEKWWKLFKGMGVVKRIQSPPVVAVSRRSFGYDYRESILVPDFGYEYQCIKTKLLPK